MVLDQLALANKQCALLDHGSMAASIEARVPFIDADVIATARLLPTDWRVDPDHPWRTKIAMREVAAAHLPEEIHGREKVAMGQGSGMHALFMDAMTDFAASDVTEDETSASRLPERIRGAALCHLETVVRWRRREPGGASQPGVGELSDVKDAIWFGAAVGLRSRLRMISHP